ncbi:hypothetical protein SEUCBS139899_004278 [Sporothrix eucalyptigena]
MIGKSGPGARDWGTRSVFMYFITCAAATVDNYFLCPEDAFGYIQLTMTVFDYCQESNVKNRHMDVYGKIKTVMRKFEQAYYLENDISIFGKVQANWRVYIINHMERIRPASFVPQDAYPLTRNHLNQALGSAGRGYLVAENRLKQFNFRQSLTNIDNDIANGKITAAQGRSLKKRSAKRPTASSETKKFSDNIAAGTVGEGSSRGGGSGGIACSSEVASGSGAALPGRRQVLYLEPEMSMADRLVSLDTVAVY